MNLFKKITFSMLTLCLALTLSFNASEVAKGSLENVTNGDETKTSDCTPVHPTPEEVEATDPSELVCIPDANLEQTIINRLSREGIAVTAGNITVGDMKEFDDFNAEFDEVSDLTGLEYATNLTELQLAQNKISSVEPLSGLTNLTEIDLNYNRVSSVEPLSGLTNLTELNLDDNNIYNIEPLSGLTNLTNLVVSDNPITDIAPVAELSQLTDLDIGSTHIADLSPLNELPNLKKLSATSLSEVSDFSPLGNITTLTELDLFYNYDIDDFSFLDSLVNLEDLAIRRSNNPEAVHQFDSLDLTRGDGEFMIMAANTGSGHPEVMEGEGNLDSITVTNSEPITYTITDRFGRELTSTSEPLVEGENDLTFEFVGDFSAVGAEDYTFTYHQIVYYTKVSSLDSLDTASTSEESELSDEELIALFEVVNSEGLAITVDQSAVDYSTPGDYIVVFTDEDENELSATLTITDVLPTISTDVDSVETEVGSNLDDITASLNASATEITEGDLTDVISIDDSSVDYSSPGTYEIVLTVRDEEGNEASKTIVVVISKEEVTPTDPEEITSEVESEVTAERILPMWKPKS